MKDNFWRGSQQTWKKWVSSVSALRASCLLPEGGAPPPGGAPLFRNGASPKFIILGTRRRAPRGTPLPGSFLFQGAPLSKSSLLVVVPFQRGLLSMGVPISNGAPRSKGASSPSGRPFLRKAKGRPSPSRPFPEGAPLYGGAPFQGGAPLQGGVHIQGAPLSSWSSLSRGRPFPINFRYFDNFRVR